MKKTHHLIIVMLLLIVAAPAPAAMYTMYKWVDDEGNTHYTQTPPMDREADRVAAPPPVQAPASPPAAAEATPADDGEAATDDQGPTEAERRAAERHNAAQCEELRSTLQRYETTPRIRVRDAGGEYRYLSEEERQAQMAKARRLIGEHCR